MVSYNNSNYFNHADNDGDDDDEYCNMMINLMQFKWSYFLYTFYDYHYLGCSFIRSGGSTWAKMEDSC
jgi:hypothetical protein